MHDISPSSNAAVDDAINSCRSVRAFLPTPVERSTVEQLLGLAARSASGCNIQPWRVRVIAGDIKERLTKAIFDAVTRNGFEPYRREWNYYPVNWREPFLGPRRNDRMGHIQPTRRRKGRFRGNAARADAKL